jgi:hypothetical protein
MQAISGALQMSGGIILLLVRQPVFCAAVLLVRTSAFALLSFGARWVGETLVCRRCCCWPAAAGPLRRFVRTVRTKQAPATICYYCILVAAMLRHVQFSLT